jgi:hypothetical protein
VLIIKQRHEGLGEKSADGPHGRQGDHRIAYLADAIE